MFQASLEASKEHVDRAAIQAAEHIAPRPRPVSAWWWLPPPVARLLHRWRHGAYRSAVYRALGEDQLHHLLSLRDAGVGWLLVAGGGVLIAVKETEELVAALALPGWIAWPVVGIALVVGCSAAAIRSRVTGAALALAR